MKLTPDQEVRLRELRAEAATLGCVVNSQEFQETLAEALRFMAKRLQEK